MPSETSDGTVKITREPSLPRFDPRATTQAGAAAYLAERGVQLLKHGFVLRSLERRELGVVAFWDLVYFQGNAQLEAAVELHGTRYTSLYLLDQHRGHGRFRALVDQEKLPVLTHAQCHLAPYLAAQRIPYIVMGESEEYGQVLDYYKDTQASRSRVWLMRHIDEGLAVLLYHGGQRMVLGPVGRAYSLHPLVQRAEELLVFWESIRTTPEVMALAMEYRWVANAALAHDVARIPNPSAIELSILVGVNHMLVADKVQNCKDFERYHLGSHPRSEGLARYFKLWKGRLQIFDETYQTWVQRLHHPLQVLEDFLCGVEKG